MNRLLRTSSVSSLAATALVLVAAPASWADDEDGEDNVIPFSEADLFFELNHTDGDLGLHGLIDGEAWKRLEIEDLNERKILDVSVTGRLRRQGLTEIFFESAEPPFDELPPAQFFSRFPEGIYEISGTTLEGQELQGSATLSHVLPAPPDDVSISGAPAAENCDAPELPSVDGDEPVIISWAPVTQSHPDIGSPGQVAVDRYRLFVEREEPTLLIFSVELPPDVTEFEVPAGFIDLGDAFKFEIQVREASGNQTVVETCFEVE